MQQGKNRYYVMTIKRNGRGTSLCLAKEPLGPDDAAFARRRAEWELWVAIEEAAAPFAELATAVHDGCLLLTGHHQDNSNTWRRKQRSTRGVQGWDGMTRKRQAGRSERALARVAAEVQLSHAALQAEQEGMDGQTVTAFLELAKRIDRRRPTAEDLAALERVMAENPGLWRVIADYAREATNRMLDQVQASPAARMALLHRTDELRRTLAQEDASPLEAAMAEQIAVCWVRLRMYELWSAEALGSDDRTLIEFWDYQVSRAQKRYLEACEGLARVGHLAVRTARLLPTEEEELRPLTGDDMYLLCKDALAKLLEWQEHPEQMPADLPVPAEFRRER